MDWSERRTHLGGSVGAAILANALHQGWAVRQGRSRIVRFNAKGEQRFVAWYSGGGEA